MPQYLVRFVQMHESFRKAELQALADLAEVKLEIVKYEEDSPFSIISVPSPTAAKDVISRSILSFGIYELWGRGSDYEALHTSVKESSSHHWSLYNTAPFYFTLDSYRGTRTEAQRRKIIQDFSYLPFTGPIKLKDPSSAIFTIFEDYALGAEIPHYLYLGRLLGSSSRHLKTTYDLKKRHYISTTSMDAELALLTANLALAGPGKIFYDPFMGTGGFPIACAEFGAYVFGSDIDARTIRGTGGSARKGQTGKMDVEGNFKQYGLQGRYIGSFISDLTNTPLRIPGSNRNVREGQVNEMYSTRGGWLDGIICDPPYGVREGLKVLGTRAQLSELERSTHADRYKTAGYIPPKRPYSFTAMLDDILAFAADTLVEGGRLSMWMPTANDEDIELVIPLNRRLKIVSVCVQPFNKWSRRLLTYRRLREEEVTVAEEVADEVAKTEHEKGARADDLNDFRRRYFEGFKESERTRQEQVGSSSAPDENAQDPKAGWDGALKDIFRKESPR